MFLKDAYEIAFESRDTWREGGSDNHIRAKHVMRILGLYTQIEDIRSSHFKALTDQLRKEGKAKATINRVTSNLSTLLTEMKQLGHELVDVKFKRQKETKGRPEYFTEEEMESILSCAAKRSDHMLLHDSILFAHKTGCRRGELLGLTDQNVDFKKQEIEFLDTKNGRDHYLPMHEDLVPVIERRLVQRIDERLFPWDYDNQLLKEFKKLLKEVGLEDKGVFHTIRHTTATLLCEKGVSIRTVMGVLNHTNVNTTLRYAKASDKSLANAIDLL